MIWKVLIPIVCLAVFVLIWIILNGRKRFIATDKRIGTITIDEIENLSNECMRVFQEKLGVTLNPDDVDESCKMITQCFSRKRMNKTVAAFLYKKTKYHAHSIFIGAYIGCLLNKHTDARWKYDADGIACLEIFRNGETITAYPLDKIFKILFVPGHENTLTKYVKIVLGQIPMDDAICT